MIEGHLHSEALGIYVLQPDVLISEAVAAYHKEMSKRTVQISEDREQEGEEGEGPIASVSVEVISTTGIVTTEIKGEGHEEAKPDIQVNTALYSRNHFVTTTCMPDDANYVIVDVAFGPVRGEDLHHH